MMFIEVANVIDQRELINLEKIVRVEERINGTTYIYIVVSDRIESIQANESYEEVIKKIEEALK